MITILLAAAIASQPASADVGYDQLVAGQDDSAIALIEAQSADTDDPARLINLGIAYARIGNAQQAKAMFEAALRVSERVELETATGEWVDSRVLARHALAMLDRGQLARASQFARK
jgi:hypothetical protein